MFKDFQAPLRVILACGCAIGVILVLMTATHWMTGVLPGTLMRDTVAVLDAPFYIDFVSSVGILLWAGTVSNCLFTAWGLTSTQGGRVLMRRFLWAGLLSAFLMTDDALLLHEQVLPDYLGLSSLIAPVIAAGRALLFLSTYWRTFHRFDLIPLLSALAMFASSLLFDTLYDARVLVAWIDYHGRFHLQIDDGLKLVGIAVWLYHLWIAAHRAVFDERVKA